MFSRFQVALAVAVPLAGAMALPAMTPASAMTSYASPAILKSAASTPVQPAAYRHWRGHHYYGGGAAFAAAALGLIGAIAAASSDECDWGGCEYYYDYGGPYYGGWGGYPQWSGHRHWGGWGGYARHGGERHAFAHAGGHERWGSMRRR
jgi:hypothetical protein